MNEDRDSDRQELYFLDGGGEMGALIRAHDWAATALGAPAAWLPALKLAVRLLLSTEHPMFIWWGEELIQFYNDSYRRSIGPERHPVALGQPGRLCWQEIWDIIGPQIAQVMEGRGATWNENHLVPITRNGRREEVYWTYGYSPIHDPGAPSGVGGVLVICTETTETVLARRRIAAEHDRISQMFQQAPGFMAMLAGPEHVFQLANAAYTQLVGHRDVIGKPVREALPEVAGQGFFELLDKVYASGEPFVGRSLPAQLHRQAGAPPEERFMDLVYQPITDTHGAVTGIFVQGADVTERKLTEDALRSSEARFHAIANSIDQMIWSTRPDGFHDYYNQRWYDFTGVPEGSTDGEGWKDMFHPDDQERALAIWAHSLATGEPYHIEYRLRDREGQYRWVIGRAQCVRDENGDIARWFGTCTDIQEIIEARDVLARSREEMERLVVARTAELEQTQEALRQSQKLEAMGQLTGGVAHDFNNLLSPIVGGLDLLQRRGLGNERDQRMLAGALQSAERAKTLVQRLLAFARKQPLRPVSTDLAGLVAGMADLVASTSGPRVQLELDIEEGLPPARVDRNQLELAILNLSVNARDAMPDGGRLTIAARRETVRDGKISRLAAGEYVRLSVCDTGSGMDEATLARAIEPFFSTKGIGKGTGLGLSMAHGLASQLGGALTIESRLGIGTDIQFWLPVSDELPQASETEVAETVRATGVVLLVDDEDLVRMSTADMLDDLGYAVVEAASAEEALTLIADGLSFDLVVTDHVMPGMSGIELAEAVEARLPFMPILVVSGYAETEGIAPHLPRLTKPFRKDDLAASLKTLLPAEG